MKDDLVRWTKERGVLTNALNPAKISGRGVGMTARRRIKKGQTIFLVPVESVRSLHTVSPNITQRLPPDISIHGLLAAELTINNTAGLTIWPDALPSTADFQATLPFLWPDELQRLLPRPARDILKQQKGRFDRDWSTVSEGFPSLRRSTYLLSWITIYTRTFLYETPQTEKYPEEDRMALLPMADLFNHAESGCQYEFTPDYFVVTADRAYARGQEVYISYGPLANDGLLAEYGFMLAENRKDAVSIDDAILSRLDTSQKTKLEESGLLGPFMLDAGGKECPKTTAALQLLCCESERWPHPMDDRDAQDCCAKKKNALLLLLLEGVSRATREILNAVQETEIGQASQRELLQQRWEQILAIVNRRIDRLKILTGEGIRGY